MDTLRVSFPRDALADVPDFRESQGRRYEFLPVLLLCCVAVMCGRTLASDLRRVETELRHALARSPRYPAAARVESTDAASHLQISRRGTFRAMCNALE